MFKKNKGISLSMAEMQGCTLYLTYANGIAVTTPAYIADYFTNPMTPKIMKRSLNRILEYNLVIDAIKTFQEKINKHIEDDNIKLVFFRELNKDLKILVSKIEKENLNEEEVRKEIKRIEVLL